MNINKLKLTVLQSNILRFFYKKAGNSVTARYIAKTLGVSPPAIAKSLPLLKKLEFLNIIKDEESKRLSIELNINNSRIINLKRVDNLKQLYESNIIEYFYDKFPGATIIVFGSYSLGEDTINSDIDIAIIGIKEKKLDLKKFEDILEREIIINYYDSFKEIHKHLKNNILNGITLKGSVEL